MRKLSDRLCAWCKAVRISKRNKHCCSPECGFSYAKATGTGKNQFTDGSELIGRRFGRLVVLDIIRGRGNVRVKCDCGVVKIVQRSHMAAGVTASCGCLHKEEARLRFTKHGATRSAEHRIWVSMRFRCSNQNDYNFKYYGGRGISVCARWKESFAAFLEDMGPRPGREFSIDRKDNDGPYCKDNCRWATRGEQARNQRSNRLITFEHKTQTLTDWATEKGLTVAALHSRLGPLKWPLQRALLTPVKQRKRLL